MPKVAILISGEYRKLDITSRTMPFLCCPDVDVYVTTWDKTIYSIKKLGLYVEEDVTANRILQDLGRNATVLINNHDLIAEDVRYNTKMINRWQEGIKLINESKIQYDYILVTRPDVIFGAGCPVNFNNMEMYKDNIGFAWATSMDPAKLPDVIFISSQRNISKLISSISTEQWNIDEEGDWHTWWRNHATLQLVKTVNLPEMSNSTFCRYWVNENHTFADAVNMQHDWRDAKLLHDVDIYGAGACAAWPPHIYDTALKKWNSGYFRKYM